MFDLVLSGGRVIDPDQGIDAVCDVGFSNGRVVAIGKSLGASARVQDVAGQIVVPGLIDMHTHVYWGGTSMGVDPDAYAARCGATTLVDAGSAGPGNINGFRNHVIERAQVRIRPFLNLSFAGIFAFSQQVNIGEAADLRLLHQAACLAAAGRHRDMVLGIKVRVGGVASGTLGLAPLDLALDVADRAGLGVMVHVDFAPPTYAEIVAKLRPGDIITHCFRPFPNTGLANGRILEDVLLARQRGVIFDLGHGRSSFGFETSAAMLSQGFQPDVLSSDIHILSDNGEHDLLMVMSRFLALGLPLGEVVAAATINAARATRLHDRGTLRPGHLGDATLLEIEEVDIVHRDWLGATLPARHRLRCRGRVLGGNLVLPDESAA